MEQVLGYALLTVVYDGQRTVTSHHFGTLRHGENAI